MLKALRHFLWLYLFYHWYLHFREYLSLIPVILLWAGAIGSATIIGRYVSGRMQGHAVPGTFCRCILTLTFTGLAPILVYVLARWFFLLVAIGVEDTIWDHFLLSLDRYFFFMILPVELLSLSTAIVYQFPAVLGFEGAFHGILLAALFFPEGGFRGYLYPHPLLLGISVTLFLLGEVLLLILTADASERGPMKVSGERVRNQIVSPPLSKNPILSKKGVISPRATLRIRQGFPYGVLLLLALYAGYNRYTARTLENRGGLLKAEMFRFDFTDYLTLETEIRQTKDLVLLYRRSEPIDRYLLKRYLLEGYDPGKGFFRDPSSPDPPATEIVPPHPRSFQVRETNGRKPIQQDLYLINLDPEALVSLDYPIRVVPYRTWPHSSFSRLYQVDAMALTILPLELSEVKGPGMDPHTLAYYTKYGKDPRIKSLAEEITRGIDTYYDRVQAIADYLQYDYYYSLKPGKAPDGDQLSHFLFTSKKGYCSYFAFSMALLCRSLGIPARVVIGFYIDPELELLGYYPVRSDMAHAWVEVYFEGYGWVDFDPTSRTPAPGERVPPGRQLKREEIAHLLKEILSHTLETEPLPPDPLEKRTKLTTWQGLSGILARILSIAILPCVMGGLLLVRFRYSLKALIHRSPRQKVSLAFWAFLQDLSPLGFELSPSESLKEALETFVRQLRDLEENSLHRNAGTPPDRPPPCMRPSTSAEVRELFSIYQQARFGPSFDQKEANRFFSLLSRVRKELYSKKNILLRILLRIHPSSMRRPIR